MWVILIYLCYMCSVLCTECMYQVICKKYSKILRLYSIFYIIVWIELINRYNKIHVHLGNINLVYQFFDRMNQLIGYCVVVVGILRVLFFISVDIKTNSIKNYCISQRKKYRGLLVKINSYQLKEKDIELINTKCHEILSIMSEELGQHKKDIKVRIAIGRIRRNYYVMIKLRVQDELVYDKSQQLFANDVINQICSCLETISKRYGCKVSIDKELYCAETRIFLQSKERSGQQLL